MFKKLLVVAALVAVPLVATQSVSADHNENHQSERKIIICHATNSADNPYVIPGENGGGVNISSVDGVGNGDHYVEHKGPVATSLGDAADKKAQGISWGDIIPPVQGFHAGLNWTAEGQTIYRNGCQFEGEEPSPVITWDVSCVVGEIVEEVEVDDSAAAGEGVEAASSQVVRVTIGNEGDAAGTVYVNGTTVEVEPGETEELYFPSGTQVQIYLANETLVYDQVVDCSETPVTPENPEEGEVLGVQSRAAGTVRALPQTGGAAIAAGVAILAGAAVIMVTAGKSLLAKLSR